VPNINWLLLLTVIIVVLGFRSSSNLASAYGIAVTLTMMIDTILAFVVVRALWKWSWPRRRCSWSSSSSSILPSSPPT
jgi:KUP system potassium uptake protein